jgi:FeS assembly SUF system protein
MAQSVPGEVQSASDVPPPGEPGASPAPAMIVESAPSSIPPEELEQLHSDLVSALKTVFDPEIPVDIYELGLIYKIDVSETGAVDVEMTLTSPACPVAESLPGEVETRIKTIEGVKDATIDLVWDPPWTPAKLSEAAKLQLGMM